jgi:hypothetical protein
VFVTGTDTNFFRHRRCQVGVGLLGLRGDGPVRRPVPRATDPLPGRRHRPQLAHPGDGGQPYTIYIVHLPIVVAPQLAAAHAGLPVLATFAAVAATAIVASTGAALLSLRVPILRTLL